MATAQTVICPICNQLVDKHGINQHIDSNCRFYIIANMDKKVIYNAEEAHDCKQKPIIKCNYYADVEYSSSSSDDANSSFKQAQKRKLKQQNIIGQVVQFEKKSNDDNNKPNDPVPYFHFDSDLSDFETDYSTPPSIERYRKMPNYHAPLCDPPPIIFRSNKNRKNKKQKLEQPVMSNIFGHTQSHEQYLSFHGDARLKYSKKSKSSLKANKYNNRKNYYLLPILAKFEHSIGDRIGAKDYQFDDHVNDLDLQCITHRNGDECHGVDYKEIDEKNEEKQDMNQEINPIALVNEVMQISKTTNWNFYEYVSHGIKYCQFILENEIVCEGHGRNKQFAKTKCAESVLYTFKMNPVYGLYASIIVRKELGIRGNYKKCAAPIGYEYPEIVPRDRYQIMQSNNCIDLQQSQNAFGDLIVYKDRGMFLNCGSDSIEQLYIDAFIKKQIKFNVKRQVPMHCHPNLDDFGNYVGVIRDYKRQELWKQIKRVYEGKGGNKWKYFVIYDFDGTVYTNRLYSILCRLADHGQNREEYIEKLDVVQGFGGMERVNALKQHFEELRSLRSSDLRVALHTFHRYHHLEELFNGIGVSMDDWFDVVLCLEHDIVKYVESERMSGKTKCYSKNSAIQMLCQRYKISLDNVLYIDDSPYAKDDVVCCHLMTIQNKGMNSYEMKEIVQMIKNKMNNKH